MSIPPKQFRRDHPWTRFVLLDSSAGPVPSQAKVTHSLTLSLKKEKTFGYIVVFSFFKDNVNEWVTFACDGTGPADESKRMKRVQGWSRLNWLGGILIIVSWHIHFNNC